MSSLIINNNLYSRVPGKCKVGARTSTCCAHVMATLYACSYLAYNPGVWRTAWRDYNIVDAGGPVPYTTDLLTGVYN